MYLETFGDISEVNKFKSGASSYAPCYRYWRNELFRFMNKLFTWKVADIPEKEIETKLILFGKCGIVKDGKMLAVPVNLFGITDYPDEFTSFSYATGLRNGERTINKDGVLIDNDSLRNGSYYIIHHYALMLAHLEVTLVNSMINGRTTETIVADSEKAAQGARDYRDRVYKGAPDVIVDKSFNGLEFNSKSYSPLMSIKDLMEVRSNILESFYETIGVKKATNKKERLITDEVSANAGLLKLNILDMYERRLEACEKIRDVFNIEATVTCNVDIDGDNQAESGGELADNGGELAESGENNGKDN